MSRATQQQLEAMRRHGGHFVSKLAEAWMAADDGNCAKLQQAFGDIAQEYDRYVPKLRTRNVIFTTMRGPNEADIKVHVVFSNSQVYWSGTGNSYVVVQDAKGPWVYALEPGLSQRVRLLSINGIGEVRWGVSSEQGSTSGDRDAAEYFGLSWHGWPE